MHMPDRMTGTYDRVEVITSVQRRRRWTPEEKIRIVEETYLPGNSVSLVARRHGIVGIDRLMRAVKSADAEMDDAAGLGRAVIAQPFDVGVQRGDGLLR